MKVDVRSMVPEDARQVASIEVRAWQTAYRGIIDPRTLREMSVIPYTRKWLRRFQDGREHALTPLRLLRSENRRRRLGGSGLRRAR